MLESEYKKFKSEQRWNNLGKFIGASIAIGGCIALTSIALTSCPALHFKDQKTQIQKPKYELIMQFNRESNYPGFVLVNDGRIVMEIDSRFVEQAREASIINFKDYLMDANEALPGVCDSLNFRVIDLRNKPMPAYDPMR